MTINEILSSINVHAYGTINPKAISVKVCLSENETFTLKSTVERAVCVIEHKQDGNRTYYSIKPRTFSEDIASYCEKENLTVAEINEIVRLITLALITKLKELDKRYKEYIDKPAQIQSIIEETIEFYL